MIIIDKVLEPFQIEVHEDQYILKEIKAIDTTHFLSKGTEGEREVNHGYFVDLGVLIKKLIQIKISREEKVMTLQQFWQAWVTFNKQITEKIDSLNLPIKQYKSIENVNEE